MPKQEAVAWAVEQINQGNLSGAKQLLDTMLALPLSNFGKQERLGAFLARGTAWAMLAKHRQLQGSAADNVYTISPLPTVFCFSISHPGVSCTVQVGVRRVGAIDDFTAAIDIEPRFADSYKRRGQARSAMGDLEGALQDFKSCIERLRDPRVRAECYLERGSIYQKQRDYRKAEAELHVRPARRLPPCRYRAEHRSTLPTDVMRFWIWQ